MVELIIGNSEQSNADAASIQLPILEVMIRVLPNEEGHKRRSIQLSIWEVVIGMLLNEEGNNCHMLVSLISGTCCAGCTICIL